MIDDCQNSPVGNQSAQPNPYLRLIKEVNIHTYFNPDLDSQIGKAIGGISALAYDQSSSSLIALSDNWRGPLGRSNIGIGAYRFSVDPSLNLSNEHRELFEVNGYSADRVDPEGMAFTPTGQAIISIESGLQKSGGSSGSGSSRNETMSGSNRSTEKREKRYRSKLRQKMRASSWFLMNKKTVSRSSICLQISAMLMR